MPKCNMFNATLLFIIIIIVYCAELLQEYAYAQIKILQ